MVCARCIMAVTNTLAHLHLSPQSVALGEAIVSETLTETQWKELRKELHQIGFELVEDEQEQLVQQVKQLILQFVRSNHSSDQAYSTWLANQLHTDFSILSRSFAAQEGRTIEKFYLLQRLEYVKELIEYGELSIKEIAWRTGFSSVAHLSRQFKQLTGLTPTAYKSSDTQHRKALDKI